MPGRTETERGRRPCSEGTEETYADFLATVPDAMLVVDRAGKIRLANALAERLFGYDPGELVGRELETLIPERFRAGHREKRSAYFLAPQVRRMGKELDLYALRKDGSEFPADISLSPLRVGESGAQVTVAAVRDMTDRKRVEQALRESEQRYRELAQTLEERVAKAVEQSRQKNQMLIAQGRQAVMGEMLSNIAHQWRQPLNMLGLIVQDLQTAYSLGEFTPAYLDHSVDKAMEIIRHMSKTIDDFRNFFRPNKDKTEFKVLMVVENALSLLAPHFAAHGIKTELEMRDDPVIKGYPNEFSQVLLNILANARDAFASRKTMDALITIKVEREGERTVLRITDNAGGIAEDVIGRIFEPYFTTKEAEHGTGVGLFLCKTIIEKNMGGRLSVRNVAQGAEFRIEV